LFTGISGWLRINLLHFVPVQVIGTRAKILLLHVTAITEACDVLAILFPRGGNRVNVCAIFHSGSACHRIPRAWLLQSKARHLMRFPGPFLLGAFLLLNIAQAQEPAVVSNTTTPPTITTQPVNKSVKVGTTAYFKVVASGTTPLHYQWYKWGSPISGATSSGYITPATTDGDNNASFYVYVWNGAGSITSNTVYLTVVDPPFIQQQPQSLTVTAPAVATFTVYVSGTYPMKYQWYKNGVAIPGATEYSYSTTATSTADTGAQFSVTVRNLAGGVTSVPATLTVKPYNGTGTYPIVGEWTGTATFTDPSGSSQTRRVVAGFWQTSYSIAGTIVFVDDYGDLEMGSGLASLNNLNVFTTAASDDGTAINLAAAFSSNLLTLNGQALSMEGEGGSGRIIISSDHKTLTGSAVASDGTKLGWRLTRTQ
jgi:hypothetical protein